MSRGRGWAGGVTVQRTFECKIGVFWDVAALGY